MEESNKPVTFGESGDSSNSNGKGDALGFVPKSADEVRQEEKSRRREKIVGAIGDGIMSLSNLFFASKGAPIITNYGGGKTAKQPTSLTATILNRHKTEDDAYEKSYRAWEEREKERSKERSKEYAAKLKEAEKNRTLQLTDGLEVLESNWDNADYINHLYDNLFNHWNVDTNLEHRVTPYRYKQNLTWERIYGKEKEPFLVRIPDENIDFFKGRTGTYHKRDFLEAFLLDEDGWTTPENRKNIIENIKRFEDNWGQLK